MRVWILYLVGWHIGQVAINDGDAKAIDLMHRAIDSGMTLFDICWDCHEGYSVEVIGKAIRDRRDIVFLMTRVCNHDYEGAKQNLEDSLKWLQTDHLDLWKFHEMMCDNAPDWEFERCGIKAALEVGRDFKPLRHEQLAEILEKVKNAARSVFAAR